MEPKLSSPNIISSTAQPSFLTARDCTVISTARGSAAQPASLAAGVTMQSDLQYSLHFSLEGPYRNPFHTVPKGINLQYFSSDRAGSMVVSSHTQCCYIKDGLSHMILPDLLHTFLRLLEKSTLSQLKSSYCTTLSSTSALPPTLAILPTPLIEIHRLFQAQTSLKTLAFPIGYCHNPQLK